VANEEWYVFKVRHGFEAIVAQRLRQLDLEVFVPERKATSSQGLHNAQDRCDGYVYCRFALDDRPSVITIPGILDIVETSDPSSAPQKGAL
jgi:hypothetical protein